MVDLPGVGANLQDNVLVSATYLTDLPSQGMLADPAFYAAAVTEYALHRAGILTNTGGDILAFERYSINSTLSTQTLHDLDAEYPVADWPTGTFFSFK